MDFYNIVCNLLGLMYNQHKFLVLAFLIVPLAIMKMLLTLMAKHRTLETLTKLGDNKGLMILLLLVIALTSIN